jgi:hypothetical protein
MYKLRIKKELLINKLYFFHAFSIFLTIGIAHIVQISNKKQIKIAQMISNIANKALTKTTVAACALYTPAVAAEQFE